MLGAGDQWGNPLDEVLALTANAQTSWRGPCWKRVGLADRSKYGARAEEPCGLCSPLCLPRLLSRLVISVNHRPLPEQEAP